MYSCKTAILDGISESENNQMIIDIASCPSTSDHDELTNSISEPVQTQVLVTRRFSGKKRVQFKADADLVQVRPITPSSPRPLHRSRSAPSFAEMAPCDPRQVEQAMERARVSDFILSLGCRPNGSLTPSSDPYYRIRPSASTVTCATHPPISISSNASNALNGTATQSQFSSRFISWTGLNGTASDSRPFNNHRSNSNGSSHPRFHTATANAYPRSSSTSFGSVPSSVTRPASANYPRLGFYRKLPVPSGSCAVSHNNSSKRIDVGNTSPFITVRRLTSSTSGLTPVPTPASNGPQGFKQSRALSSSHSQSRHISTISESETCQEENSVRHGVVSQLTGINVGATI